MTKNAGHPESPSEFPYRVDFYWQALLLYIIALAAYAFIAGTVESGFLTFALDDPVVILLAILIVQSSATLVYQSYMRRSLIVEDDAIIFRNRLRQRTFKASDISSISLRRDRFQRMSGISKLIRIRLYDRRRALRIRPGLYDHEDELTSAMAQFKQKHQL